jgi:bacteriocin biosynthesis cyclodehydratase domain-containing protein
MTSPTLVPRTRLLRSGDKLLVAKDSEVRTITGAPAVDLVETLVHSANGPRLPVPTEAGPEWHAFVALLTEAGLVTTDPAVARASGQARLLWDRCRQALPIQDIDKALRRSTIPVLGSGTVADRIRQIIEEAGPRVVADRDAGSCGADIPGATAVTVVVGKSLTDPTLLDHNVWALEHRLPWLAVVPDDAGRSVVGPYIVPGSSACFRCYLLRRAANFPDRRIIGELSTAEPVPTSTPRVELLGMGWFTAALTAEKVLERVALGDYSSMSAPGSLASIEPARPGVDVSEHRVLRVPRCPTCSPAAGRGLPQVWFHGGERP